MDLLLPVFGAILGIAFLLYLVLRGHWSEFAPAERRVNKWILGAIVVLFLVALALGDP